MPTAIFHTPQEKADYPCRLKIYQTILHVHGLPKDAAWVSDK
jgi:hypothetical protein